MRFRTSTVLLLSLASLAACDRSSPNARTTTAAAAPRAPVESYLPVEGGRTWYRVSGSGNGTPVILLHGGPGFSSFYLKPLEALGDDRPVVRYDQMGSGKSGTTTDTALFTIPRFVRELDSLRTHLGYERVHLVGHSWGTILALEYYRVHPERVASLTLASPALDIPAWERNARRLVGTLSDSAQTAIRVNEAAHTYDTPAYQAANNEFFGLYVMRRPNQVELDSLMSTLNQAMYMHMQGPSEFTITGTLKSYDAKPYLPQVKVPTLYTVGEFDEADPPTVRHFAELTPGARVEVIPNAAHIVTWDNPEATLRVVREFLRQADARRP